METVNNIKPLNHQFVVNDPLHQLFDAVESISVQGYDDNRRVIYWNIGSEKLYGYTSEEALGQRLEDLIIPEDMKSIVVNNIKQWLEKNIEIPASELILRHKKGHDVNVMSNHVLFTNVYQKKQLYCIDIDLSEVKEAQAQAIFKENLLEAAFKAIPDLFFLMEENGTIVDYYSNNKINLYAQPKDFIGKSMLDVLPYDVAIKFKEKLAEVIVKQKMLSLEYELAMPQGLVHFEARINYLPEYKQIVTIVRDITEQHKSAEIIRRHAYYDTLTFLPNRFLALDRLSQMISEAERDSEKTAILFLDLDDFKKVNDTLGHEIGDKLLIESANRLTQIVRKKDTVGRLGGDEFIILLRGLNEDNDALTITENLLNSFRDPFKIDGRELMVTLSIGIAIYPDNGICESDLLRHADIAMYQAKALGRNTYSFFTKEMNVIMLRRLEVEEQMHGALERNEFEVYYQPQISWENNEIIGAEALLRWNNPKLGNVTPDEFIPIAEHTGLIVSIGHFVVQQALNFLHEWQTKHQNLFRIAVNLSPRQFRDANLISFIESSLQNANIPPKCLELEITEGVLMIGQSYIDDALEKLNKLGVKLSMDDFGTGYSSLSYLRQYNFDVLKIDKSFIDGITKKNSDLDLVKATISMAHSLGLTVISEGVETKEQILILNELQCDYLQGYYFSKPIPANQLLDYALKF